MTNLSSAAAALGKKGGKSKSPAKSSASRTNGKLGGRPANDLQRITNAILRGAKGRVTPEQARKFAEEVIVAQESGK